MTGIKKHGQREPDWRRMRQEIQQEMGFVGNRLKVLTEDPSSNPQLLLSSIKGLFSVTGKICRLLENVERQLENKVEDVKEVIRVDGEPTLYLVGFQLLEEKYSAPMLTEDIEKAHIYFSEETSANALFTLANFDVHDAERVEALEARGEFGDKKTAQNQ